jgi:hypothetical protein
MQKKVAHLFIIIVVLLVPLLIPHQAHACSCGTRPFRAEFEDAHAVFIGTVTHIQDPPPSNIISTSDPITYTFRVHRVLKGTPVTIHKVQSVRETMSCGAGLEIEEMLVVYAFWYDSYLGTYLCNLNHPVNSLDIYFRQLNYSIEQLNEQLGL